MLIPRWRPFVFLLLLGVSGGLRSKAEAVLLPVVNPSFEALTGTDPAHFDAGGHLLDQHYSNFPGFPVDSRGFLIADAIPGWSGNAKAGTFNPSAALFPAGVPDGQNTAWINVTGGISQTLAQTFEPSRQYRLSVDVGAPAGLSFPGYVIGLYAYGQPVAEDSNTKSVAAGGFATASVAVVLPAGSPAVGAPIEIRLGIPGSKADQTDFDNVRLTVEAPVVTCAVAPSGLVGWWRAEGDRKDTLANGDGTAGGKFEPGVVGQAFSFGGTAPGIIVGNPAAFHTQDFSIEAWVKRASTTLASQLGFGAALFAGGDGSYSMVIQDDGSLGVSQVGVDKVGSAGRITDTLWHHVAVTKAGPNVRFYIDGEAAGSAAYDRTFTFGTPFAIGSLGVTIGQNYTFLGSIDELGLYNRPLSAAEIASIHQAGAAGKCPVPAAPSCATAPAGLVAWYPGEGTAADGLGSHPGTFPGARFAAGKVGQAFEFDGSNQVGIKDSPEFDGDSFTIETWVFPTVLDGAVNIIANKESGSQFYEFQYEVGVRGPVIDIPGTIPVGNVAFYLGGVTGLPDDYGGWIDGLAQAPIGRWTHVALAVSPGTATVYVDGEATRRLTGLGGSLRKTNGPLKIGARDDSFGARDRFKGRIDEFSFYGRALTGDEIASVFQAGAAGKCVQPAQPSPVAIVAQPASKTVLWGTEATFSVAATGTAPLTYQWRFKGADIPGATGPQLFVGAVGKVSAGDYSVTVCNPVGCVTSAPATLTVTPGPAIIRAINSTTKAPEVLSVPIVFEANGVENALSFSLRFDPEQLDYQGASRSGTGTAQLLINDSRADEGLLGVVLALPAGGKFPEGVQELLRLNFRPRPAITDSTRALRFTDDLTLRQLADVDAKSLGSGWVDGFARVIAADYEGDVSPAPGGDKQVTVTDWVLIGRYVAGLEDVPTGSAFQRADCAPLSAGGNGRLTVADWVQAGRFAVGLDPVRSAGGPLNPTTPPVPPTRGSPLPHALGNRAVSLSERTSQSGEAKEIAVQLAATGDENALAFSVSYDPAALRFLGASIGADATQGMLQMNMQQAAEGRVGLALALTAGANFSAGNIEVAKLRFAAVAGPADSAELSFTDAPVFREIAAPSAETLPSAWVGTSVGVVPATLSVSQTLTPDGPAIVLAWPAALAGAGLETAVGLDSAWEPVAVSPVAKDGRNTMTLPLSHATGYYRLKLP